MSENTELAEFEFESGAKPIALRPLDALPLDVLASL